MSQDDFSKTLVIPNPGGRRKDTASDDLAKTAFVDAPSTNSSASQAREFDFTAAYGENKVLTSANQLLFLAGNIRTLAPEKSVELLRQDIEKLIYQYEQQLQRLNVSKEILLTARYLICCLLDEFILTTPWGVDSNWAQQTLLSKYHNETSGGEKFFLIVEKLLEKPHKSIDLIELSYVCISLGFSGKYRISQHGEVELSRIGERLCQAIITVRPTAADLSPAWQGLGKANNSIKDRVPLYLVGLICLFVIALVYIGLISGLKSKVDPLYQQVESIAWADKQTIGQNQFTEGELEQPKSQLNRELKAFIENDIIRIGETNNTLSVQLVSPFLFNEQDNVMNNAYLPDLNELVQAIAKFSDKVIVLGHGQGNKSVESDWVVSRKRAEAVANWLSSADGTQLSQILTRTSTDQEKANNQSAVLQNPPVVEILLVLKG